MTFQNIFFSHFQANHPDGCEVIADDCNKVLREIMDRDQGIQSTERNLPQKGQVDMICGGPPCQGFSIMNIFQESDESKFKNSLISSYLSYCDFFRPSYFILENVKNFAQFNGGRVLKLCMRALVMMGYQCQFGVLQAGNFGKFLFLFQIGSFFNVMSRLYLKDIQI